MAHDKQQGAELENEMEKDSSKIARKFVFTLFCWGRFRLTLGPKKAE